MAVLSRTHVRSAGCVADVAVQLTGWPDLSVSRTRKAISFRTRGREIIRMRGDHTAELLLTVPVIDRWARVLIDSNRVTPGRDAGWIKIEIEDRTDAEMFLSLVSVALKVNQR
ncbi:luciferase domain-containing protein [Sphaerisporangium corydalis]|uniref:Luciferase family protein n=1 Tax=Sphaerisporangium corydalis TaxID=1441875 RepID=A0ABV9ETT9_9ACTN|nr:luciferase family protein [Sphaerisporangium corydalis]